MTNPTPPSLAMRTHWAATTGLPLDFPRVPIPPTPWATSPGKGLVARRRRTSSCIRGSKGLSVLILTLRESSPPTRRLPQPTQIPLPVHFFSLHRALHCFASTPSSSDAVVVPLHPPPKHRRTSATPTDTHGLLGLRPHPPKIPPRPGTLRPLSTTTPRSTGVR